MSFKVWSDHATPQPPEYSSGGSTTVFQVSSLRCIHLPRTSTLQRSSTYRWSAHLSPQSIRHVAEADQYRHTSTYHYGESATQPWQRRWTSVHPRLWSSDPAMLRPISLLNSIISSFNKTSTLACRRLQLSADLAAEVEPPSNDITPNATLPRDSSTSL